MLFKCKACGCKDEHIASLKAEIAYLRVAFGVTTSDPTILNLEAQKMLDGALSPIIEIIEPSKDKHKEMLKVQREAEMIFSGAEIIE